MNDEMRVEQIHNQLLQEYLSRDRPRFRACSWCGGNLLDYDYYYEVATDELVCERCIKRKSTEGLEADE